MTAKPKNDRAPYLSSGGTVYDGVRVKTGAAAKRHLDQAQESLRKLRAKQQAKAAATKADRTGGTKE